MATSFNRNPLGSNQFILRTDEEIQAIIDSYPDNWTKKDFRGEGKLNKIKILTRKETERPGLKFKFTGKRTFKEPNIENIKRSKKIKTAQGGEISIRGGTQIGKNFSHIFPIIESAPPGTKSTGVIDAKMNRALEGYNRVGQKIAEEQKSYYLKINQKVIRKKILELNALAKKNTETAVKNLGKNFKGTIGYFRVNPDTGEFVKKGGNFKKTFAGVEGEDKIFKDMTGKERKTFERKISNLEKLKTIPGVTTASNIKTFSHMDSTSYPSKTYVRDELKKVPVETKVNPIKDFDIPKGTILKGLAKGTLRAVAPFVPFVGAMGVALGVSDVAKAKDQGLEGEELGIAYLVGPELAKKYSDFKDRNLDVETESEEIMGI